MDRIDELTAQVDQLRHQNKKLDAEAEHLEALFKTAVQAQAQSQATQALTTLTILRPFMVGQSHHAGPNIEP